VLAATAPDNAQAGATREELAEAQAITQQENVDVDSVPRPDGPVG
jgi:hypothetical protein